MTEGQSGAPALYALADGEEVLVDLDEIYFRQCPPAYVDGGVPSVRMFEESSADGGKLSGARSAKTTARDAYEYRVRTGEQVGRPLTAGTWGVTVGEVEDAGSRAVDDSRVLGEGAPPGHTYLDYRHLKDLDKPSRRAVRARLHQAAIVRGRIWPESVDPN